MLTLKQHKDNVKLCDMRTGNRLQDVYWNPKRSSDLQNSVEDISAFFTPDMIDRFELSREQQDDIIFHLKQETVSTKYQSKFYKIKKYITENLFNEMDLSDSNSTFEVNFPKGSDTWPNNLICAASTSAGKTWEISQRVLRNLKGPKKDRRKFLWFSSEWNTDRTLAELKKEKYKEYIRGCEISDQAVEDSDHDTAEEFFKYEIELLTNHAPPGNCVIFDDPIDSHPGLQTPIRNLINKALRVSRHKQQGVMFILHRIRSGAWSVGGSNSCKYFLIFPRAQKGKCIMYLNQDMGLQLGEARRAVKDFGATGRPMYVQLFAPNCLIGTKLLRLI